MLKIVSNTTPIIALLKLGKLDFLEKLYGEININLAVYSEIEAGSSKSYYQDLKQLNWINIIEMRNINAVKYFSDLDACR